MTVEFFYDINSPYSYLAATQIAALSERTGHDVQWRPFLLGGVFRATGNQPPAALPARGAWMLKDLYRWAAMYDVPFSFPSKFPMNSLLAMRALTSIDPATLPDRSLAMFRAYWVDDKDLESPEVVASLLGSEAVAAAANQEAKDRLRASSDEAVARGAFGAPTFFVGDEMWFGNDRIPQLEHALGQ